MTPHLTPDELVDAVEQALAASRRTHLASCAACQAQVDELQGTLGAARQVGMPEPSPLFFDHLTERVQRAIAASDAPAPPRAIRWFQWPVLAPMGALAVLLIVLIGALPDTDPAPLPSAQATAGARPDPATAADDGWEVIANLLADLDLETVRDAGVATAPGSAERAVATLTDAERAELVRLLEEELKETGG